GRQVEAVALVVGEQQVVALGAADGAVLHADVAADPVHGVDHDVAGLELGDVLELRTAAVVGGAAAAGGHAGLLAGVAARAGQLARVRGDPGHVRAVGLDRVGLDAYGVRPAGVERAEPHPCAAGALEDLVERPVGGALQGCGATLGGGPPGRLHGLLGLLADL